MLKVVGEEFSAKRNHTEMDALDYGCGTGGAPLYPPHVRSVNGATVPPACWTFSKEDHYSGIST
jgi:hypothetical protein